MILDNESVLRTIVFLCEVGSLFFLQSPMFDGKVPHWHHFSCFWQRAAAQSTSDIDGFSSLRWEDQEKVKKAIETGGTTGGQSSAFKSFLLKLHAARFYLFIFSVTAIFPQEEQAQRADLKRRH